MSHVLAIAGVAQLFVFALLSVFSRKKQTDGILMISTVAFAALWFADFRPQFHASRAEASVVAAPSSVISCASVSRDMTSSQVQSRIGAPDEKRSDEETRGPGATIWIYRDSRCAVHMFDDKVEFIE